MHRRDLLIGALATAFSATASRAEIACNGWSSRGWRTCHVGVPVHHRIARQRCPNWCWAACIEAVFALNGYAVDQEAIVAKLFGRPRCATTSGRGIVAGINGRWMRADGDSFTAEANVLYDEHNLFRRRGAIPRAASELAGGRPLIIGTLGHVTVMTGMTYARAADGAYRVQQISVCDPWPDEHNPRTLSREETAAARFLARVTVTA